MSVSEVSANEAIELLEGDAVLIDVREESEWEAGHAPMASLVPLAQLPDHLDELPRDHLIICACRSGGRSLRAATYLQENGFDVVNLSGGMLAWFAEDLPFESDGDEATIE
jgi:rhodanese-related sulfurtransferase